MRTDSHHIIEKLTVEIDVSEPNAGFRIRDNVGAFVDRYVIPAVERYLAALEEDVPPGRILRVDRLRIDVAAGPGGLEEAPGISASVALELEEAFERSLRDIRRDLPHASADSTRIAPDHRMTTLEPSVRLVEAVVHFIRYGTRPWWISRADELDEVLSGETLPLWTPAERRQLADAVIRRLRIPAFRKRLVRQLTDKALVAILLPQTENAKSSRNVRMVEQFLRLLQKEARLPASAGTREQVWALLFPLLPGVQGRQTVSPESLIAAMERKLPADYAVIPPDRLALLVKSFLTLALTFSGESFSVEAVKAQAAAFAAGKSREAGEDAGIGRQQPLDTESPRSADEPSARSEAVEQAESLPKHSEGMERGTDRDVSGQQDEAPELGEPVEDPHGTYVDNAGLVVVHPFLKHLFLNTGQLEGNKFVDPVLAVHMLHYLATGREQAYEHEMLFEKYLVGIPADESIPRMVPLGQAIREEIAALLDALKQNWPEMASSSHEAIRETFLQRPGKLLQEEPHPRLVVERKTVDILMDRLGWAISIVRFPWKEEILYVEW